MQTTLSGQGTISNAVNQEQLVNTSNFMYRLLMAIGIVTMVLVGTILGIKFMISSAEDKAEVKKALVPYIIGCIVIFGAFTIWSIAVNIGQDIISPSGGSGGAQGSGGSFSYDRLED